MYYQSDDKIMKRPTADIVCVVATTYSLLLYLLYQEYEKIKKTFFVFDNLFPEEIAVNIENSYRYEKICNCNILRELVEYRRLNRDHLPKINKNTRLFAQDHLTSQIIYLSGHPYTMIEDSSLICQNFYNSPRGIEIKKMRKTLKGLIGKYIFGDIYLRSLGDNKWAQTLLLSKDDDAAYLKDKRRIIMPPIDNCLWKTFRDEKKSLILYIMGVDKEMLSEMSGNKILLLTNPLAEGGLVTIEEQKLIYKSIASKYDESNLIIKTHPRDKFFDYREMFPKSLIIDKIFPSEMFSLLNVDIEKVVTLFSSAVNPFLGKIPVDWYGAVGKKLKKAMGYYLAPAGVNIKTLDIEGL